MLLSFTNYKRMKSLLWCGFNLPYPPYTRSLRYAKSCRSQEKQIDTHHLFDDFKFAFETPHRDHLYATMSEFGIPAKLIRLCEMTFENAQCVVKVGNNLS